LEEEEEQVKEVQEEEERAKLSLITIEDPMGEPGRRRN